MAIQYVLKDYRSGIWVSYKFKAKTIVTGKIMGSLLLYLLKYIIDRSNYRMPRRATNLNIIKGYIGYFYNKLIRYRT